MTQKKATKKVAKKVVGGKAKSGREYITDAQHKQYQRLLVDKSNLNKDEEAGGVVYRVVRKKGERCKAGSGLVLHEVNVNDLLNAVSHILDAISEHGMPREVAIMAVLTK